jgi:hypothetical protein
MGKFETALNRGFRYFPRQIGGSCFAVFNGSRNGQPCRRYFGIYAADEFFQNIFKTVFLFVLVFLIIGQAGATFSPNENAQPGVGAADIAA